MREWLDSLGLTGATPQPQSTVVPNTNLNQEKKINWTHVIAAIAAIGALLSGIAALIPILKPSPPTSPPSLSPSPSSTKTP